MLETIEAAGGAYVAMFVLAVISGAFPLVNGELALITVALNVDGPRAVAFAVIVAAGQTVSHTALFSSARGLISLGEKRRKKLEARIERARAAIARWRGNSVVLLFASATLGLPPLLLFAIASGGLAMYRLRTFIAITLLGRIVRFTAIAIAAQLV